MNIDLSNKLQKGNIKPKDRATLLLSNFISELKDGKRILSKADAYSLCEGWTPKTTEEYNECNKYLKATKLYVFLLEGANMPFYNAEVNLYKIQHIIQNLVSLPLIRNLKNNLDYCQTRVDNEALKNNKRSDLREFMIVANKISNGYIDAIKAPVQDIGEDKIDFTDNVKPYILQTIKDFKQNYAELLGCLGLFQAMNYILSRDDLAWRVEGFKQLLDELVDIHNNCLDMACEIGEAFDDRKLTKDRTQRSFVDKNKYYIDLSKIKADYTFLDFAIKELESSFGSAFQLNNYK